MKKKYKMVLYLHEKIIYLIENLCLIFFNGKFSGIIGLEDICGLIPEPKQ